MHCINIQVMSAMCRVVERGSGLGCLTLARLIRKSHSPRGSDTGAADTITTLT